MKRKHLLKVKKEEIDILDFIDDFCNTNDLKYFLIGGTLLGGYRHKGFIPWDDDIDVAMMRDDYDKFIKLFKNNENFYLDCYKTNENYWLPFLKVRKRNTSYVENVLVNYSGDNGIWVDIFPIDNGGLLDTFRFKFVSFTRIVLSKKNNVLYTKNGFIKELLISICTIFPKKFLIFWQEFFMKICKNNDSEFVLNLGSQYGEKKQKHLRKNFLPLKLIEFEGKKYSCPANSENILKKIYGVNFMQLPPVEKRVTHNPVYIKFSDGEEVKFDETI